MTQPEFSVVLSCYYEEISIFEFYGRLAATLEKTGRTFEVILTDDGSQDRGYEKLQQLFASDERVTCIIQLFRNYGQAAAITAGTVEAIGRHFIFIDSDLQLSPEDLPDLLRKHDEGISLVTGVRRNRKDPFFRRLSSKLLNPILRLASRSQLSDYGCTFKVINGTLLREMGYGRFKVFSSLELISHADSVCEVPVSHQPRRYGRSGWTLRKLAGYFCDAFVMFATRHGIVVSAGTLIVGCCFGIEGVVVAGLLVLSLLSELVRRIYLSSQNLPSFTVRRREKREYGKKNLTPTFSLQRSDAPHLDA